MGKIEHKLYLHQQQGREQQQSGAGGGSSRFCCGRCPVALGSRFGKEVNFRCFLVLILSLSLLVSGIFWIVPLHKRISGFDAKDAVKKSAVVQAFFQLQMPAAKLVPLIGRLEYDIYEEIGLPDTKVAILSMHQPVASNWTNVVFGVLPDTASNKFNPVSLSLLKSSLVEVFLKKSNLTLTTSIFEKPFKFEILKYPGGLTVIPSQSAPIWEMPQILFNFTLNYSISEIQDNFVEFKEQLKIGLNLRPYENAIVQLTNIDGSTVASHVIVEVSIMSDQGSILPQRLKQLAMLITGTPVENLGLDNTVFGEVNSISLSSYLRSTLTTDPPAPSPQPSTSPSPNQPPTYSPAPSTDIHETPPPCGSASPPSFQPTSSPNPTVPPPRAVSPNFPPRGPTPVSTPTPARSLISPSPAPSTSSTLGTGPSMKEVLLTLSTGLIIVYNLCWSN